MSFFIIVDMGAPPSYNDALGMDAVLEAHGMSSIKICTYITHLQFHSVSTPFYDNRCVSS